jgi:hypothetical protein
MTDPPTRRRFVSERVSWTARRQSRPSGIRFVSAFGEERVLPLEPAELPTEEQLVAASERQLEDWLVQSRRKLGAELTAAERALLRRITEVGGRYTFRPDGQGTLAYRVFNEGIVSVLLSLQAKHLVTIQAEGTESVSQRGAPARFTAITAELTDAGRAALE